MKREQIKKEIIETLKNHPGGLTLTELTEIIKANKITITKYVYELVGEGIVKIRKVGSAKLCYL